MKRGNTGRISDPLYFLCFIRSPPFFRTKQHAQRAKCKRASALAKLSTTKLVSIHLSIHTVRRCIETSCTIRHYARARSLSLYENQLCRADRAELSKKDTGGTNDASKLVK